MGDVPGIEAGMAPLHYSPRSYVFNIVEEMLLRLAIHACMHTCRSGIVEEMLLRLAREAERRMVLQKRWTRALMVSSAWCVLSSK